VSAPATDPARDAVAAKDNEVVQLRSSGKSFMSIARTVGLDSSRDALAAFNRGIRSRPARELAELRAAELKRLDVLAKRVSAQSELSADDISRRLKSVARLRTDLLAD
jgi:hypothetical protein